MVAKTVLLFCAQALIIQCISSQYIGAPCADGLAWGSANALAWEGGLGPYGPYGAPLAAPLATAPFAAAPCAAEWAGYAAAPFTVSNGGSFQVTSMSPIAPTGVALTSENAYEGALAVTGALPFLGAVALEGPLPTAGMGAVNYGCGNGNVAMLNEDIGLPGPYGPYGAGYAYGPLGYEATIAGPAYGYRGCGYGTLY